MANLLDELLVGLGYDYDDKEVKKFSEDLEKTTKRATLFVKAIAAGISSLTGFVIASTRASDEQGKLADEIGDTVDNISALQFAQQRAGGSAEGMATSLQTLSIRAAEAARGVGSGIEAFGILGIEVQDAAGKLKPASAILLEVSKRFQTLDKAQQLELADKLGLRDSIRLLQQGPAAIKALTDEARALGVTTEEDAAISEEFQDALVDIWTIIKQVSRVISRELAPIMLKISDVFIEWWKTNRDIIELKAEEYIKKVSDSLKILTVAAGAFIAVGLVSNVISLIGLLNKMTLSTLAFNAAALLIPALISAAIIAIGLLAEDAKVFFEGGDSFIGDMLKKYPQWTTQLNTVAAVFATLWDLTSMIFEGWKKIFDIFNNLTFDNFKSFLGNLPGFLGDIGAKGDLAVRGAVSDVAGGVSGAISNFIDKLEISIPGAGDPESVANAVFNVFQQTTQDLSTTVDQ